MHNTEKVPQMPTVSAYDLLEALDIVLRPYILKRVCKFHLSYWYGLEEDITEEVLSETFLRVLPYVQRGADSVASSIRSFEALCKTIAKQYLLDLRRKDKRLSLSVDDERPFLDVFMSSNLIGTAEEENIYTRMFKVAQSIKKFPVKQRAAILIDLANRADFDDEEPSTSFTNALSYLSAIWRVSIPFFVMYYATSGSLMSKLVNDHLYTKLLV